MLYFKHSELVNRYHVSLKTVHNWIAAAKQGKLELRLHEKGTRTYIANNPSNIATLDKLAQKGKKYRNVRHHKVVTPKPEFYDYYSRRQILDIISNLNIHHEIPRQYNYMDGGATNWDKWLQRLEREKASSMLKGTLDLMHVNLDSIDLLLNGYSRVNVIDVGVGNARPAKELLEHLLEKGLLHRYIAIDISPAMLDIAEQNVKKWFGGKVKFEGHLRDIRFERFDDLLVDDMLAKEADQTINLVLLLGGTLNNFRSFTDAVKVMYGSMGDGDLFVYSDKPDSEAERHYFDFSLEPGSTSLSPKYRFILDLLNIDESLYDAEMGYNEQKHMRYVRVRLNTALTLKLKFEDSERDVHMEKGDTILLLRVWHMTVPEIISEFEKAGFALLQSSMTKDRQYLLTISGVDANLGSEA